MTILHCYSTRCDKKSTRRCAEQFDLSAKYRTHLVVGRIIFRCHWKWSPIFSLSREWLGQPERHNSDRAMLSRTGILLRFSDSADWIVAIPSKKTPWNPYILGLPVRKSSHGRWLGGSVDGWKKTVRIPIMVLWPWNHGPVEAGITGSFGRCSFDFLWVEKLLQLFTPHGTKNIKR